MKIELINPLSLEQQVFIYNTIHDDSFISINYLSIEEIKDKYPEEYKKLKS